MKNIKKTRKPTIKQKILLILLAVFFTLCIIEVSLKIVTFTDKYFYLPNYDYTKLKQDEIIIFCLGGSITYGVGVVFENSYPVQLEHILNNSFGAPKIKVFNLGVPGYDSTQILERFKLHLNIVKPDIVIASMGANDYWTFDTRTTKDTSWLWAKVKAFISASKISRFFSVVLANIGNTDSNEGIITDFSDQGKSEKSEADYVAEYIQRANILRKQGTFEEAEACYNNILKRHPNHKIALLESGRNYKLAKKFDKALNIFLQAFLQYPDDSDIYTEIRDTLIRQNDLRKTVSIYLTLHDKFPRNKKIAEALSWAYIALGGEFFLTDDLQNAEDLYIKALALDPGRYYTHKEAIQEMAIYKRIYNNFEKLANICQEYKITLIICGYPNFLPRATKHAAMNNDLLLIDHSQIFKTALRKYPDKKYFISDKDPHCTKEGYRLMAENIAKVVLKILKTEQSAN